MARAQIARAIAGVAVLLTLAAIGIILIPPYAANWKLQRYVNELVEHPATGNLTPEEIRARVVGHASSLGLPVHGEDVQVRHLQNSTRIDVLYVVHVDVASYSVVLHFRPAAGGT
jgi:hypothetical protein